MTKTIFRFAGFTVDSGAHGLYKGAAKLAIQEQPWQVLLALLERPGEVVTRETLRMRLWGTSTFVDFDQSLNSAVRRLRLALEDNSREPTYVETLPRVGFRFRLPVEREEPAATPQGDAEPMHLEQEFRPHLRQELLEQQALEQEVSAAQPDLVAV